MEERVFMKVDFIYFLANEEFLNFANLSKDLNFMLFLEKNSGRRDRQKR